MKHNPKQLNNNLFNQFTSKLCSGIITKNSSTFGTQAP